MKLLMVHGIPVAILDRTWLLDRVYMHNRMDIVQEELGIGTGSKKKSKTLGPKTQCGPRNLTISKSRSRTGASIWVSPQHRRRDARRAALLRAAWGIRS